MYFKYKLSLDFSFQATIIAVHIMIILQAAIVLVVGKIFVAIYQHYTTVYMDFYEWFLWLPGWSYGCLTSRRLLLNILPSCIQDF